LHVSGPRGKALIYRRKSWIRVGILAGVVITIRILQGIAWVKSMSGAVVIADTDPRKQLTLPGVDVVGTVRGETAQARSDATGFFRLTWKSSFWRGESAVLRFSHPAYQVLETREALANRIYIARLSPAPSGPAERAKAEVFISNVRVRYSIKATSTIDVGSTAETFQVVNTGDVPCPPGRGACSPDGMWKAAIGTFSLDADEGQEFQNARVSCIAGPCPFTKVETDGFSRGGRKISGAVRAWSDTTTFLVEAEVLRTMLSDMVRQSYPSIFGRTMTFTLPHDGQGPAIQAEVDGTGTVFPLGPALILSWASCNLQIAKDRTKIYSCALNPGYSFR
jgi:hypothetical protein